MGFFRPKPKPQSAPPQPQKNSAQPTPDTFMGGNVSTWASRLITNNVAMPTEPVPFAAFHRRALIIGIGDFAADVLELLCERMDDTNTFDSPNRPLLLHLAFSKSNRDRQGYKSFQYKNFRSEDKQLMQIVLDGEPPPLNQNDVESPTWRWMKPFLHTAHLNSRLAARLILFQHLQAGENAGLRIMLEDLNADAKKAGGEPIDHVYIVASALDDVGSNVIGDLAALLRYTWGNSANPIMAIVCLGDNQTVERDNAQKAKRVAAALELAHLTSSSRLSWTLPADVKWNTEMRRATLLDEGAIGILSNPDATGTQQVANILWGLVTTSEYWRSVTSGNETARRMGGTRLHDPALRAMPTLSLAWSHSAIWPVRFLRQLIARQVMTEIIGSDVLSSADSNGRDLSTEHGVELWLDDARSQGLLPWLRLYAKKYPNDYMTRIIKAVLIQKHDLSHARPTTAERLKAYSQLSSARQVPIRIDDWINYAASDIVKQVREQLLSRIGFIPQGQFLILAAGQERWEIPDPSMIEGAFRAVENKLEWYATQMSEQYIRQFKDTFERGGERNNWINRFHDWRKSFTTSLGQVSLPTGLLIQRHLLNVSWEERGMGIQYPTTADATFSMQSELIPRLPLENFPPISDYHLAYFGNVLTLAEHQYTLDYFGRTGTVKRLLEIPFSLQAALLYQDALKVFALWWNASAFERIIDESLRESHRDQELQSISDNIRDGNWEDALWTFIRRYENNIDDRTYLVSPPKVDNLTLPIKPSGSAFAEKLAIVLEHLLNPPPDGKRR